MSNAGSNPLSQYWSTGTWLQNGEAINTPECILNITEKFQSGKCSCYQLVLEVGSDLPWWTPHHTQSRWWIQGKTDKRRRWVFAHIIKLIRTASATCKLLSPLLFGYIFIKLLNTILKYCPNHYPINTFSFPWYDDQICFWKCERTQVFLLNPSFQGYSKAV